MDYEAIKALARDDLQAVNREIEARLQSDVILINQMGSYIVHSGGKRLRPVLVLLGSRALGYEGSAHIQLAAIIEFIHTATLLHDDVVDASEMRRGHTTANSIWGNEASVLVGDFLYSRAFEMMVEVGSMRVMEILAHTTNTIAKGEVMQLLNCHDPETTEERYIEVIQNKTAKLFQAGSQLSAIISNQSNEIEKAMAAYGMHLGTAFQLIDDALDYGRDNHELGKNIGDDLAEGKPTLPLIYSLRQGNNRQRELIRAAIEEGGLAQMDEVMDAIESTGSITYTARRAEDEASRASAALAAIPDSPYKQALLDLAHFSAHRNR
ncbi:MAG: octaprenyl diphosphate synthase [Sulfuricaulis sp.]|uniref:octaprenyl diphosphate synthase n=1 Tax=Sulfuricaulis sp. TaxID=2003553 RepID=UPI003C51AF9E